MRYLPCEDFEKNARSVLNYNLDYVLDFKYILYCLLSASVESCGRILFSAIA